MARDDSIFKPDLSKAGSKSKEGDGANWTWFSPPGEPDHRFRYAVIKEEGGLCQILPDEARFKKGLKAWRFAGEEETDHTVWMVLKTKPNRIDLKQVKG